MKKLLLLSITLSLITLASVFVITHTSLNKDSLLMEKVQALADDPWAGWIGDEPGGIVCDSKWEDREDATCWETESSNPRKCTWTGRQASNCP